MSIYYLTAMCREYSALLLTENSTKEIISIKDIISSAMKPIFSADGIVTKTKIQFFSSLCVLISKVDSALL